MTVLTRIWRGMHWSEQYGSHPGNAPVVAMIVLGCLAGGVTGAVVMALMFGPLYIIGAYKRGEEQP